MKKIIYFLILATFVNLVLISIGFIRKNQENQKDPLKTNSFDFKNFPPHKTAKTTNLILSENEKLNFDNQLKTDDLVPLYFSIKNIGHDEVNPIVVVNNQDWSSEKAIIETIFKNDSFKKLTDEEKIIKLTKYLHENIFYGDPLPTYKAGNKLLPIPAVFNLFGFSQCSQLATILAALGDKIAFKSRIFFFDEHVVTEIYYDNHWHMFDASLNTYLRNKNNKIASVDDIFNQPSVINQIKHNYTKNLYQKLFTNKNSVTIENYESGNLDEQKKKIVYTLGPQEEIRFYYDWQESYFYKENINRPEFFSNGVLISPIKTKEITYQKPIITSIQLPYPILGSYLYYPNLCNEPSQIEFSLNKKDWTEVNQYCQNDTLKLVEAFPKGKNAEITNDYYLKLSLPSLLEKIKIYTQFQVAPRSIPKLQEGKNIIELKNAPKGKVSLNFTYR